MQCSVIIPTFRDNRIAAALASISIQKKIQLEVIVVDGANEPEAFQSLPSCSFPVHFIHEKDNGVYDAMNKGIKAAKGKWVYFLNAGDSFFSNNTLAEIFENIKYDDYELIYAKVQTVNEPTGVNYINGKPVKYNDFFSHYPICHQATFTHKKAFDTIGLYNIKYKLVADNTWFALFFKTQPQKAIYIDKIIAFYDIQGATYHKRMLGYKEYIHFGWSNFPLTIAIKNWLMYPVIWLKVKLIRTLTNTSIFKFYRKLKFGNKVAQ
jgi:glycosyltransferase involved in cell wall biosynthesis